MVIRTVQVRLTFCSSTQQALVFSAVGLEVEMEEVTSRSHSDSRDRLTPELLDPAPQKKKKKKRAPTIGTYTKTDEPG